MLDLVSKQQIVVADGGGVRGVHRASHHHVVTAAAIACVRDRVVIIIISASAKVVIGVTVNLSSVAASTRICNGASAESARGGSSLRIAPRQRLLLLLLMRLLLLLLLLFARDVERVDDFRENRCDARRKRERVVDFVRGGNSAIDGVEGDVGEEGAVDERRSRTGGGAAPTTGGASNTAGNRVAAAAASSSSAVAVHRGVRGRGDAVVDIELEGALDDGSVLLEEVTQLLLGGVGRKVADEDLAGRLAGKARAVLGGLDAQAASARRSLGRSSSSSRLLQRQSGTAAVTGRSNVAAWVLWNHRND